MLNLYTRLTVMQFLNNKASQSQPVGIWFCSRQCSDWPAAPPSQLWKGSHLVHTNQQPLTRVHKLNQIKNVMARHGTPEGAKQS